MSLPGTILGIITDAACVTLCRIVRALNCSCVTEPGHLVLTLRWETVPAGELPVAPLHPYSPLRGGPTMAVEITAGQRLRVTITPVDAQGHPAPIEQGSVAWAVSDADILSVTPEPTDEKVALVRPAGSTLGVANVTVSADADLGEGVVTLAAEMEVAVTSGMATSLGLTSQVEEDVTPEQLPTQAPPGAKSTRPRYQS
jgi:hypothetical protein